MISDRLDKLVEEMVDKGVQFEDAVGGPVDRLLK